MGERGIYLGTRDESGEAIVGTPFGVVKAKDFRRIGQPDQRWNLEEFNSFNGVPWEPVPGQPGQIELKSKVNLPADSEEITRGAVGEEQEYAPRRLRITRQDVEKFGYTVSCPGCRAVNRGLPAQSHSEDCRKRIIEEI